MGFNLKIRGLRENATLKIMESWNKCLGKAVVSLSILIFKKKEDRYSLP